MYKLSALLTADHVGPFRHSDVAAREVLAEILPDAVGMTQTTALEGQEGAIYAGVLELYFRDTDAIIAAQAADFSSLLTDDTAVSSVLIGMERVVTRLPGFDPGRLIKGVYPFRRHPDISVEFFQHYWWHIHGPIAALTEEAHAYTQLHVLPACYEHATPAFDGITEIYWPDMAAAARAVASRQMVEDQGSDAPNFVDMSSIVLFFAKEDIVLAA